MRVHPGIQQNLVRVVMVNWGSVWGVINAEICMGWKPHKLEGCRGLNNFFTRLGATTEFCRGNTNVSGVHPDPGSDEGCLLFTTAGFMSFFCNSKITKTVIWCKLCGFAPKGLL